MAPKNTLTKSLHTVTAVANVARFLGQLPRHLQPARNPGAFTDEALRILGYDAATFSKADDTVVRCVLAVSKVLE